MRFSSYPRQIKFKSISNYFYTRSLLIMNKKKWKKSRRIYPLKIASSVDPKWRRSWTKSWFFGWQRFEVLRAWTTFTVSASVCTGVLGDNKIREEDLNEAGSFDKNFNTEEGLSASGVSIMGHPRGLVKYQRDNLQYYGNTSAKDAGVWTESKVEDRIATYASTSNLIVSRFSVKNGSFIEKGFYTSYDCWSGMDNWKINKFEITILSISFRLSGLDIFPWTY